MAEALISNDVDTNHCFGKEAQTPSIQSILRRNDGLTQLLLGHGANPNQRNGSNESPLQIAIQQRNVRAMELLLQHGAKINANTHVDVSPFRFFYLNSIDDDPVRHDLTIASLFITKKESISHNADMLRCDNLGHSAGLIALEKLLYIIVNHGYPLCEISSNRLEQIQLLLHCGVNPNATDTTERTVLLTLLHICPQPLGDNTTMHTLMYQLLCEYSMDQTWLSNISISNDEEMQSRQDMTFRQYYIDIQHLTTVFQPLFLRQNTRYSIPLSIDVAWADIALANGACIDLSPTAFPHARLNQMELLMLSMGASCSDQVICHSFCHLLLPAQVSY